MNTNASSIKNLDLLNLKNYIISKGWINDGEIEDLASIWHRKEEQFYELELILPSKRSVKDYRQRIIDLIQVISIFEKKLFEDVLNEINNFHSDLIKIRVVHEDVKDGNIPINDGILLFERAKDLMLSVIKSTFDKQKFFSGGKLPDKVSDFLNNVRLGQTEHGSYVVNIISPIYTLESEQEDFVKNSISRLVSETLTKSLDALNGVIKEFKQPTHENIIDKSIEKGVSANLCDAIIGLSGESKNRDVSISVAMSSIEPIDNGPKFEYTFHSNNIHYLQKASEYFKGGNVIYKGKTISGFVIKLMHKEDAEFGGIEIETEFQGINRKVKLEKLPTYEYWEAHSAHKEGICVICTGDLIISPRSAQLINLSEFKVVKQKDVFQE